MKAVGYPNLESGYPFIKKHTELDVARGAIDPNAPIVFSQEEDEITEKNSLTLDIPTMIHNKDYHIDHGLMTCGSRFTCWRWEGKIWIKCFRWIWPAEDVVTVSCYRQLDELIPHPAQVQPQPSNY